MKYESDIVLGDTYRDQVSGWKGVATAVYFYLNKCVRVSIDASDENGKPKGFIFDAEQIMRVPETPSVRTDAVASGGPRDSTPVPR